MTKRVSKQLDMTSETSDFDKTWARRGVGIPVWAEVSGCDLS